MVAFAVLQSERAAMGFGDLTAKHQADARSFRLGREERDKEVCRVGDAGAVVLHPNFKRAAGLGPADFDGAVLADFERGIDGVPDQIDDELLQLVAAATIPPKVTVLLP